MTPNSATPVKQQPATISVEGNQLLVTALVHADNMACQSAKSALPVPGLTEVSANDVESLADSGVTPTSNLQSALVDIMVGDPLATLQLGKESGSAPAPGPGQSTTGPGQGPGSANGNVTNWVTDPQAQVNTYPPPSSANVHTGTTLDAN